MSNPKVLIQNEGPLGGAVEQVELDSNRVNVQGETQSRLANFIAISSRGVWVDVSQWLVYSAGFFSLVRLAALAAAPFWAIALCAGLPLYVFICLIAEACQRRKSLRIHASVRFMLLVVGGAIAAL